MAKEQFFLAASKGILNLIDAAADKAGLSRGQAFDDFLTLVRCSLAGQTMEEEYLATVRKGYDKGEKGKRGIDLIVRAFAELVNAMEETGQDILGDIFTGGITYGERGQFFTPDGVAQLMADLTLSDNDNKERRTINDPACGSGRFLLAVAKKHRNCEFIGQDVDHRCAQMTAINLGLNGLYGWAVWQNTLTLECYRVYKIGLNLTGGVIREVKPETSPFYYDAAKSQRSAASGKPRASKIEPGRNEQKQPASSAETNESDRPNPSSGASQLDLF
ncbi:N-6 DNA methylase [Rhodopirellula sp. MGV]|uniref:N-6 DNA methylase n=1 Tax=Rhodopirellula sp. MGV TaxID=2023130 RepID=UPI000B96933B|nr:N-6 DNA methylase [Rhodopirellula sp. MGV]OYP28463.1 hypothetical protein CGZ80_27065 [Rhodopirellula sp. MGV]PNY38659.1 SAM-dependent DNA methyltransferase [Rhodopirellula baltica]